MIASRQPIGLFLFLLLFLSLSACNRSQPEASQLGVIDFEATGAEAAQSHFHKGLLLLHSFEYDDARAAFQKAQEIDSSFVMAYWGEAMTHHHSLWRQQDYEAGNAALAKLAADPDTRRALAATELERELLQAAEVLYGEGTETERNQAYADQLAQLYAKYPGNHEVAAFYALSILGAVPVGRDEEAYGKGARIAKGILEENPNHPGALHYLIHSYDDPGHAQLALNAANSYAEVAPDAAHALHMPSHIYVALGMWDEVVSSNEASWEASVNRMERLGLDNNARSYHALAWLQYGYLQQGRTEDARRLMAKMVEYAGELPSRQARAYLVEMTGTYLVESGDWQSGFAATPVDIADLNVTNQGIHYFTRGLAAYEAGDTVALRAAIDSLSYRRAEAERRVIEAAAPMCSAASNRSAPNQLDIDQAKVMEMELMALPAMARGADQKAEDWLQKAATLAENISYAYGPPVIVKPPHELYGEWLLAQNRPQEALQEFEKALERGPKRRLALTGKLKAAEALQDGGMVKAVQELLEGMQRPNAAVY